MTVPPLPFVTIGMPCLNEEGFIEACVRGALAQDYPADRLEVLVADYHVDREHLSDQRDVAGNVEGRPATDVDTDRREQP